MRQSNSSQLLHDAESQMGIPAMTKEAGNQNLGNSTLSRSRSTSFTRRARVSPILSPARYVR